MDRVRVVFGFLKGKGYTLNFQTVRAEVNRVVREGKGEDLDALVRQDLEDDVYEILFGG